MLALDEVAKHAVDFWLSTEDLPMPDNRVTVERDGNIKLSYTPSNQVPKQKLYDKLKSMLNHLGMHDHLIPRNLYMKNEIGIGGVAHQAGTAASAQIPRPRCWTPTARRTSWTTCTSSIPASSRASAR